MQRIHICRQRKEERYACNWCVRRGKVAVVCSCTLLLWWMIFNRFWIIYIIKDINDYGYRTKSTYYCEWTILWVTSKISGVWRRRSGGKSSTSISHNSSQALVMTWASFTCNLIAISWRVCSNTSLYGEMGIYIVCGNIGINLEGWGSFRRREEGPINDS